MRLASRTARTRVRALRLIAVLVLCPILWGETAQVAAARGTSLRWFWVQRGGGWKHLHCQRLLETSSLQIYVPSGEKVGGAEVRSIAATYIDRTLPTNVRYFGLPRRMGVVNILLAPLDGETLGYFDQNDLTPLFSHEYDPVHANRGNILYVQIPSRMPDRNKLDDVNEAVAHELQHLMNYRQRVLDRNLPPEEDWLNEGLSFLAQVANGYWTPRDVLKARAAAAEPSWPLSDLSQSASFLRQHARVAYGRAGLFVTYLAAQFGPSFVHELVTDRSTGMQAVDTELRETSSHMDASTVFANWGVAQYLASRGKDGYGNTFNLRPIPPAWAMPPVSAYPFDTGTASKFAVQPWTQQYLRFTDSRPRPGELRLRLDAAPNRIRAALILEDSNHVVPRKIRWLTFAQSGGPGQYNVSDFGGLYDRATLVLNGQPASSSLEGGAASPVRVRATLVNGSDDDRVARVASTARDHLDFSIRQVGNLS